MKLSPTPLLRWPSRTILIVLTMVAASPFVYFGVQHLASQEGGNQPQTVENKQEQQGRSTPGYIEAQRRIQQAIDTQATDLNLTNLSLTQVPLKSGSFPNFNPWI